MEKLIIASPVNSDNSRIEFKLDIPKKCPNCSVAYADSPLNSYYTPIERYDYSNSAAVYSLYFCPHCNQFFSVRYITGNMFERHPVGVIYKIYPAPTSKTTFSFHIKELSPEFVDIYHQAEQSENLGLTKICGIGYRKALEFLVKDYAIKFNPDKSDSIQSIQLANCINTYIDSKRIQSLAKASAWIGNDETHYVRKHENYNLQHLKAFISSIVSYVDAELSYLEAELLLTTPKK